MAFAYTTTSKTVFGNKHKIMGAWSSTTGVTENVIDTDFTTVENFQMTGEIENVAVAAGVVTVTVTDPAATVGGFWSAIGS